MTWTEDQIAKLKRLRAKGLHTAEIIRQFPGKTKGAVIGKMNRMGLIKHSDRKSVIKTPVPKKLFQPIPLAPKSDPPIHIPRKDGVEFFDLKNHHCRWPFGDENIYFCGRQKRNGSPYCEYHHHRARTGSQWQ